RVFLPRNRKEHRRRSDAPLSQCSVHTRLLHELAKIFELRREFLTELICVGFKCRHDMWAVLQVRLVLLCLDGLREGIRNLFTYFVRRASTQEYALPLMMNGVVQTQVTDARYVGNGVDSLFIDEHELTHRA